MFGFAPCGVYPARSPGAAETMEDRWVTIHVQGDDDWLGLKRAMGCPAWADDPRFATNAGALSAATPPVTPSVMRITAFLGPLLPSLIAVLIRIDRCRLCEFVLDQAVL